VLSIAAMKVAIRQAARTRDRPGTRVGRSILDA
jgi:hypothetical protein